MNTSRKIAIIVGVLYLAMNIAGPLAKVLETPILGAPDYLSAVSANETRWLMRVLFGFIMAVAIAGVGPMMYPILKRHNESIAVVYAGERIIEGTLWIVAQTSVLSLSSRFWPWDGGWQM